MPTLSQQITHEQIISAIGRIEGLIEAEGEARREFRASFSSRLEAIERSQGQTALEIQKLQHRLEPAHQPTGIAYAVIALFERQPLLGVIVAGVILGLGSGGVVAIWEALAK